MNLCYELLNEDFEVEYGEYCNITIENTLEYRRIVESLPSNEIIYIYEDEKKKKYHIIPNVNFLDFSDKKILNKVYNDLILSVKEDKFYKDSIDINNQIITYVHNLVFDYPYSLEINDEVDFLQVLKSVGLRLDLSYDSFLEKFINYLDLQQKIFSEYIFYTLDLSNQLTSDELLELKRYIEVNNILIINFDLTCFEDRHITKRLLFDKDLCRIM